MVYKSELINAVKKFKNLNILVLGDLMVDTYLFGNSTRLSPEAPVPVIDITESTTMLGGAGNVISNLEGLNIKSHICGIVGSDPMGDFIVFKEISGRLAITPNRPTTTKTRVVSSGQQLLRFDIENRDNITEGIENSIIDYIKDELPIMDAIIISDYGKGVVTQSLLNKLNALLSNSNKDIIVTIDPKSNQAIKYREISNYISAVTPNHHEAIDMVGEDLGIEKMGNYILKDLNCKYVLITEGKNGMSLFSNKEDSIHIDTVAQEVFDVSGAGDTVISVFTLALALGMVAKDAAVLSNIAAGVVVGEVGTSAINTEKLIKALEEIK